ncbi:polysaccharide deacetylase family protein [Sphingobacterium sp.]|uniref:polysaccharide deacetylase family protein n=1 Tax=Sphingobacterium sp. TaxID=341027 RepID=UPI00289723BF|nr:polysaccharide deacetylase family protein [Sphingobacterium sp.]
MDSNLNKLSPLVDFANALIPAQMPNEDAFRSAPFKDMVGWLQGQLDLKGSELLDPVAPGTQDNPAVIHNGSAGQKGKFEPQPGFYKGFPEVTQDRRWYFYWDGSSWSLKDLGALPDYSAEVNELRETVTAIKNNARSGSIEELTQEDFTRPYGGYIYTPRIPVHKDDEIIVRVKMGVGNLIMDFYDTAGNKTGLGAGIDSNTLTNFVYIAPSNGSFEAVTSADRTGASVTIIRDGGVGKYYFTPSDVDVPSGVSSYKVAQKLLKNNYMQGDGGDVKEYNHTIFSGQGQGGMPTTQRIPVHEGDIVKIGYRLPLDWAPMSFYDVNNVETPAAARGAGFDKLAHFEWRMPADGTISAYTRTIEKDAYLTIVSVKAKPIYIPYSEKEDLSEVLNTSGPALSAHFHAQASMFRKKYPAKGVISIIDDDGNYEVYNTLYPLLKSRGLKFGAAIVANWIDSNFSGVKYMTSEQLAVLQRDPATFEALNHTYTSANNAQLTALTKEQQWWEIYENHKWLINRGFEPQALVSPSGAFNDITLELTSRLYHAHYKIDGYINTVSTIRNLELSRMRFGKDAGKDAVISQINEAVASGGWLVLMTHVGGYDTYPGWLADFTDILNYIQSSGITCELPSDAFRMYANFAETYQQTKMGADLVVRPY